MKQSSIKYTVENNDTYDVRIRLCGFWRLIIDNYRISPLTNTPHYVITNIHRDKYEEIYDQIYAKR